MPPHTISPSLSSQGLGIYQSTLSPPPTSGSQRFTGMVPRPQGASPTRPSPNRGLSDTHGQPLFQAQQPRPSPTRGNSGPRPPSQSQPHGLPSPPRGQPLFQPTFSLRPTHTRTSSAKGFTSFSALPPSPSNHTAGGATRPMGPRASTLMSSPRLGSGQGGPSNRTDSDSGHSVDTIIPSSKEENPIQRLAQLPVPGSERTAERRPSRSGSIASNLTAASKLSRAKSNEMLRKLSRGSDVFGVTSTSTSGRYQPLSGNDDHDEEEPQFEPMSTNVETSPVEFLPFPRRLPYTSSGSASGHSGQSSKRTPTTDESYSTFNARSFPLPPSAPVRSGTTFSDPADDRRPSHPPSQGMGRSLSQPLYLYSVPELNSDLGRASGPSRPDSSTMAKRTSDISSGVHSRNAALLSAETGGTMLAFSPTGDGTWRTGEVICGSGTGLIPSPRLPPKTSPEITTRSIEDEALRSRPWSDSTMSQHMPKPTILGHRGRSLSDGAQLLARQGTLLHPASSNQRASAELGVLLGGPKSKRLSQNKLLPPPEANNPELSWDKKTKVRLEASKKGKARVEVDVVLERECVVEGGEVRGRMEVRISGGKRGEGLRVGAGKIRVVGFEEISGASRHIFYHQPHTLPIFDSSIQHNLSSSLFASGPDSDGYRLASEGSHSIPFRMRLPLGGGAKGTYSSPGSKGPSVRYVVVGSIKIHIPSTGKRSIAHFYRSVVILPYLNPSLVLAPSPEPVEAYVERGLGWSLTGEKGRVELRVSMGRRIWVSGQRLWCEVAIRNDSSRKIKSLNIALLQTVQAFHPQPMLDTRDLPKRLIQKRRSMGNLTGAAAPTPDTPDLDACQTSTQMRKICEEVTEADFASRGAGRVTGKGWWTGVEPGEQGHWDMSLQVPPGMISIRRTRLLEVQYTLRVTLNGSIYVDLPVQLINFLSIDPPPMPGDALRATAGLSQTVTAPGNMGIGSDGQPIQRGKSVYGQRSEGVRNQSGASLDSLVGPARASSTTLHIDALLQAGRARAEAEAQYAELRPLEPGVELPKPRPISMGSTYTLDLGPSLHAVGQAITRTKSTPTLRPKGARMMSYRTTHSDSQSILSEDVEEDEEEMDRAMLAARRAQARQRSLAVIHDELDKEQELLAAEEVAAGGETPPEGEYRPCHTPSEENLKLGGDTPSTGLQGQHSRAQTPLGLRDVEATREGHGHEMLDNDQDHQDGGADRTEIIEEEYDSENEQEHEHVGDQTILEDLVGEEREELEEVISMPEFQEEAEDNEGGNQYDYGEEVESDHENDEAGYLPRSTSGRLPFAPPSLGVARDREMHISQSRSINGSFAASAISGVSEQESEVGQVYEAVKRNVSTRLPSRLLALHDSHSYTNEREEQDDNHGPEPGQTLTVPQSGSVSHALLAQRRASHASINAPEQRRGSAASLGLKSYTLAPPVPSAAGSRRGSGSLPVPLPTNSGRRNSSVVKESSPLRASITEENAMEPESPSATARVIQKKSSFSFATPGSPLKVKVGLPGPSESIRKGRGLSPGLSPKSTHPTAMEMARGISASSNSQLKNEVVVDDNENENEGEGEGASDEDHPSGMPGLAPSIVSDTSSEGCNALDSPPTYDLPHIDIAVPQGHGQGQDGKRSLPNVPSKSLTKSIGMGMSSYQTFSNLNLEPSSKSMNPSWVPGQDFLQTQVNFMHDPTPTYNSTSRESRPSLSISVKGINNDDDDDDEPFPLPQGRRGSFLPPPSESSHSHNHDTPMGSPTSSCHSILPSVKTKIAQLNSREEALRKFSVSGASISSPVSPRASVSTSAAAVAVTNSPGAGGMTSPVSKRRSYTSALAPKPMRSSSDDHYDNYTRQKQQYQTSRTSQPMSAGPSGPGVGHTTYFSRRTHGISNNNSNDRQGYDDVRDMSPRSTPAPRLEPFGTHFGSGAFTPLPNSPSRGNRLERGLSNCSTSTTATDVERAINTHSHARPRVQTQQQEQGQSQVVRPKIHVRSATATSQTLKVKSSGYWEDDGFISGSQSGNESEEFRNPKVTLSARNARVNASEGTDDESLL